MHLLQGNCEYSPHRYRISREPRSYDCCCRHGCPSEHPAGAKDANDRAAAPLLALHAPVVEYSLMGRRRCRTRSLGIWSSSWSLRRGSALLFAEPTAVVGIIPARSEES